MTRFTPAYAGNTSAGRRSRGGRRVHPRIRGEYEVDIEHLALLTGSPPHTRGIPWSQGNITRYMRFTPAYAGNTNQFRIWLFHCQVHPRIRGEYRRCTPTSIPALGSPPHTRGIPADIEDGYSVQRFTPAYAGNTSVF